MADVTLQIIIPEANVQQVLTAFTHLADKNIMLLVQKANGTNASWSFRYADKNVGETTKEFAVRAILSVMRAIVRMDAFETDRQRYDTDIESISPPSQNIPDDIITGN